MNGARLGLVVNPIAGLGGRVGLKGTDGVETLQRAIELGAQPVAPGRAVALLRALEALTSGPGRSVLVGPGDLGETEAREATVEVSVIGMGEAKAGEPTTAADTRRSAAALRDAGVELLLFVGGDGTAADVLAAVGSTVPVLGVPAGVKMQSAVFATGVQAAAQIAASYLARPDRATCVEREVMDLDEAGLRAGRVSAHLLGTLLVPPAGRLLQSLKAASPLAEAAQAALLARAVAERLPRPGIALLGPGTTMRSVATGLGIPKTLLGIDVVAIAADGSARLVGTDCSEQQLLALVEPGRTAIVVSPTGGQGFVLGRGNQQLSPAVIRLAGPRSILVVATEAKLAALVGRPLLLDTGDADLDRLLAGYLRVLTGPASETVCRLEPG